MRRRIIEFKLREKRFDDSQLDIGVKIIEEQEEIKAPQQIALGVTASLISNALLALVRILFS